MRYLEKVSQLVHRYKLFDIWQKVKSGLFRNRAQNSNNISAKLENGRAESITSLASKKTPILIFQMGRVGSISIKLSLERFYNLIGADVPIYHAHWLNDFDKLAHRAKKDMEDPSKFEAGLENARKNREKLLRDISIQSINVVSIVRDPVARNISTFFFALDEFIPDWEDRVNNNSLDITELQKIFLSKRSFVLSALNWFDEQMAPVFDIDVFAKPFPMKQGYETYSSSKANLLVLRLENLEKCSQLAFSDFLDLKDFNLLKTNTGEERKTGNIYKLFKLLPLPTDYVEWTYNSKLARHFYSEDELKSFSEMWTLNSVH